jgi:hypothetical protein
VTRFEHPLLGTNVGRNYFRTMKTDIKNFLTDLTNDFDIVKEQVDKYYNFDDTANIRADGAVRVLNRTWVGPTNYGLLLFPPADKKMIEDYEKMADIKIPDLYKGILATMNGCFIYDFSLFGIPKSMYENKLLDRSDAYQFDIGRANNFWTGEYDIDLSLFHFGGRHYSYHENTGYFIEGEKTIHSILKSGQVIKSWTSFKKFIEDEVIEAEKMMREDLPKELEKK